MKIQQLTISNFRSFRDFSLTLAGDSVFIIGECAIGKTSLLTAIARGLGKDYRGFTKADFIDLNEAIEIRLTLSDLDPHQAAVFCDRANFKDKTLRVGVRVTWDRDDETAVSEHGYPDKDWQKSSTEDRQALALLWLPADRDVPRMLQFGYRRNLMGKLIAGPSLDENIQKAISDAKMACAELGKSSGIWELLVKCRAVLSSFVPGISPDIFDLIVSASTELEILRQLDLGVSHEGPRIPLGQQSSGLVQLIGFAFLVQALTSESGTILLVDQPENSLHPQPQRALIRTLERLNCQVVMTTHSSNVLDHIDPRKILRLCREDNEIQSSRPSQLSDSEARKLARYTTPQTAEALFAKAVILVEGASDFLALRAAAQRLSRDLDSEGITIVDMEGAGGLDTFLRLLGPAGFRLKVAGLCDSDKRADWERVLKLAGVCTAHTSAPIEQAGFHVCNRDLEDELIRAFGGPQLVQLIEKEGDRLAFDLFCGQTHQKPKATEDKLHGFLRKKGRNVQYAPLIVESIDLAKLPAPLKGVLASV